VNETFAGEFGSSWRGLGDRRVGWTGRASSVSDLLILATVFGVTFVAELPDKSLFASLVLGTRYRPVHV
jgi:putative Ca2+/H+ antiporter (TMEM165/GDT1 family)